MDPEYAAALEQAGLLKGIPLPKTVAETRAISDLLYIGVHNQFLQSYLPPGEYATSIKLVICKY